MDREILEEKVYYYTNVIEDPKKLVDLLAHKKMSWLTVIKMTIFLRPPII